MTEVRSGMVTDRQSAPVIETGRLKLRAHALGDFPDYQAMWADPIVTRFVGGAPLSREQSWARLIRYAGMWAFCGYGFWAVEEKASGRIVGEAGFLDLKRDIDPPLDEFVEAGWLFSTAVHGRGYAAEAVGAALAWAQANLRGKPIACIIDPGNAPSLKLAARFGFAERARATYHGKPTILLEREQS
jgi:RimJ/RimL family protein N-acetyltransferase